MRALFVSNGHGEAAIADRIARELLTLVPDVLADHLALVGEGTQPYLNEVGPRRAMPSGGLIAMGNVRNIARDVGSGLLALTLAQYRFLRAARGRYDVAIAVGDVFALMMALAARAQTVFVGTAKSVNVAAYGPMEERALRRARAVFVRDDATAERLRAHRVNVEGAANVIVDLCAADGESLDAAFEPFDPLLALLPGSRASAYEDGRFLLGVVRELAREFPALGAALSVAPGLDPAIFAEMARNDGWSVSIPAGARSMPFALLDGSREIVRAWRGPIGSMFDRASLAIGQAGTANEAAAAAGVPVVAFGRGRDRKNAWYRKRQSGLLGEALAVLDGDRAIAGVRDLLLDPARRARMGAIGRERMGPPGGARRVAARAAAIGARA